MRKIKEEKILLAFDNYLNTSIRVRRLWTQYLQQILQTTNEINLDNINISSFITVSYDGGDHPEYASNLFSVVNRVYLDTDGDVLLDTEDASGYSISNITTEELGRLCCFISNYKKELYLYDLA